jgi:hypothetical protein
VPQNAIDVELYLRRTKGTTTLPLLIWLASSSVKTTVVVAPLFLPRIGMCPSPQENWSFGSGFGHVVLSGKNNGVVPRTLGVMHGGFKPFE